MRINLCARVSIDDEKITSSQQHASDALLKEILEAHIKLLLNMFFPYISAPGHGTDRHPFPEDWS